MKIVQEFHGYEVVHDDVHYVRLNFGWYERLHNDLYEIGESRWPELERALSDSFEKES